MEKWLNEFLDKAKTDLASLMSNLIVIMIIFILAKLLMNLVSFFTSKAMKKAAGTLRLDLAQYREMETFSQFSGDMDESTKKLMRYGGGLMKILKQKPASPRSLAEQVFMLVIATCDKFEHIDPEDIDERIADLVDATMKNCADIVMRIENEGVITDEDKERIKDAAIAAYG